MSTHMDTGKISLHQHVSNWEVSMEQLHTRVRKVSKCSWAVDSVVTTMMLALWTQIKDSHRWQTDKELRNETSNPAGNKDCPPTPPPHPTTPPHPRALLFFYSSLTDCLGVIFPSHSGHKLSVLTQHANPTRSSSKQWQQGVWGQEGEREWKMGI